MITESKLFSWHYGKMVRFLGSAFSAGGARFGKKGIRIDYADRKIILSPILPSPGMSELVMSASPLDEMLSSVLITLRERGQYAWEMFNNPIGAEPESTLSRRQRIEVTMAGGRIHEMALSLVDSGQPLILEFTPAMTRTMPRTLSVLKTALTRAYMEANADSELLIAWSRVNDPAQGEVPGADAHPWATPAPRPDTQEGEAAQ